ncbi:MAG: hypothetical protein LBP56_05405 [Odoribacteraceae bacterium]|jgi:hypothetical protein|nr:hypothetical protein [Odoribacteraceae bacterium]
MKTKHILYLLLFCLPAWGCADEDPIVPEGPGALLSTIPFPQGDDPWDTIFEEIYREYGVKILYKDFTDKEWSRSWVASVSSSLTGGRFETPAELNAAAAFMKHYIFDFFDPDMLTGVFRPYIYLVKDMKFAGVPYTLLVGMDNWTFSPVAGTTDPADYTGYVYGPKLHVLTEILTRAFVNGRITLPAAFYEGVDYKTPITSYRKASTDNEMSNISCRRGFLDDVTTEGLPFFPDYYSARANPVISEMSSNPDKEFASFVHYILILRDRDRYFADGCRFEHSPLLKRRMDIVEEHLKRVHGVDLIAYQEMAYEGYTGSIWETDRCTPRLP